MSPEGVVNGQRGIMDGIAYFGTGEMSGLLNLQEQTERSYQSKSTLALNDIVIHKIDAKRVQRQRIFEIRYSPKFKNYILKDKKNTMGVFLKMENSRVSKSSSN